MADVGKDYTGQMRVVPAGAPSPAHFTPVGKTQNPILGAVGNFFYELGFATEYWVIRGARVVRDAGLLTWQALTIFARWFFRVLQGAFKGLVSDVMAPFHHFNQRRKALLRAQRAMHSSERQQVFARARAGSFLSLLGSLFTAYVLPVGALAVLVLTVYNVLNFEYALAVEYNGKTLGYVTDQTVVEGAKSLLRGRIKLADNQEVKDWQLQPVYTIARTDNITTTTQLANQILLAGGAGAGDIVSATGLYMGKDLVAVTNDGAQLRSYLDELLQSEAAKAPQEASVGFVADVACDPESDEVFFASSVRSFEQLRKTLASTVSEEVYATADGKLTLGDIAVENNLAYKTLQMRNPQYEEEDSEFVPKEGEKLLIQRAKPFLQVQSVIRVEGSEPIPYETEQRENPERPKGVSQVVQRGAEGIQQVWDDQIWIDGELDHQERRDELTVVIQPAVKEIIEIGTRAPRDYLGDLSGPGFIFPVPGTTYSSRGYSPGGHRGLDINAPAGSPIYASEAGVVVNAGWHYSYGNYVEISHGNGINTLYAHCSALYVSAGQRVGKGAHIAAVGSTGNSSGNHCHLELTINGQLTDPVAYVGYPY